MVPRGHPLAKFSRAGRASSPWSLRKCKSQSSLPLADISKAKRSSSHWTRIFPEDPWSKHASWELELRIVTLRRRLRTSQDSPCAARRQHKLTLGLLRMYSVILSGSWRENRRLVQLAESSIWRRNRLD